MSEKKYPWVVVEAGDGFICSRNGKNGIPETGCHYYVYRQDAQQEADWNNKSEGITDAPRFEMNFLQQIHRCEKAIKAIEIQKKMIEEELKKED